MLIRHPSNRTSILTTQFISMSEANGWYIGTRGQCIAYNNQVSKGEDFRGARVDKGKRDKTERWAQPEQHPVNTKLYKIAKHVKYSHAGMQHVNELDETWQTEELK